MSHFMNFEDITTWLDWAKVAKVSFIISDKYLIENKYVIGYKYLIGDKYLICEAKVLSTNIFDDYLTSGKYFIVYDEVLLKLAFWLFNYFLLQGIEVETDIKI